MIRCAPAAILRSRRSHSVAASAAVGSRAQAIVKPAGAPIGLPARVLAAVEAGEDLDEADRIDVPDARAGRVVADPRRIAGQGEDVADAQRVRAEQLRLEGHEVPVAGREVDEALEVQVVLDPERDGHRAHPDAGHRRVADVDGVDAGRLEEPSRLDRPLDADGARRVDLDGDDEPAVRERPRRARSAAARRRDGRRRRRGRRVDACRSGGSCRPAPRCSALGPRRTGVERRAHRARCAPASSRSSRRRSPPRRRRSGPIIRPGSRGAAA